MNTVVACPKGDKQTESASFRRRNTEMPTIPDLSFGTNIVPTAWDDAQYSRQKSREKAYWRHSVSTGV
jgi:hypothetical protein